MRFAHKLDENGFTLIEIVMVLVLLGILSAVAVPKYFDLQEEADAKTCRYNRSVALESIYTQFAVAKIDGKEPYDSSSTKSASEWAQTVVDQLATDSGKPLCPADGTITAKALSATEFSVTCSKHSESSDDNGSNGGKTSINSENAKLIADWLFKNYQLSGDSWSDTDYLKDLDSFFSNTYRQDLVLNSEVEGDDPLARAMSEVISDQLAKAGYDTDNIVWSLARVDNQLCDSSGNPVDNQHQSDYDQAKNNLHWASTLVLTVVDKKDMANGTSEMVNGTQYSMRFHYGSKKLTDGQDKLIDKDKTEALVTGSVSATLKKTQDGAYRLESVQKK